MVIIDSQKYRIFADSTTDYVFYPPSPSMKKADSAAKSSQFNRTFPCPSTASRECNSIQAPMPYIAPLDRHSNHYSTTYDMGINYTGQDKMSDVIASQPSLLQMISRFGIQLGVGERTVREVCEASKVDTNTFLAVANIMKEGPSVAQFYVDKIHMPTLMRHLRSSTSNSRTSGASSSKPSTVLDRTRWRSSF